MSNRYCIRIKHFGLDLENINSVYERQKKRFTVKSKCRYHYFLVPGTKNVSVLIDHEDDVYIGEFDTLFYDLGGMRKRDLIDTIHGYMEKRGIK